MSLGCLHLFHHTVFFIYFSFSSRPGQFLRNCSYFAFWSLEAVLNMTQDSIFDMLVHERSFSRGAPTSYPPPEQFYYPSTYNFGNYYV